MIGVGFRTILHLTRDRSAYDFAGVPSFGGVLFEPFPGLFFQLQPGNQSRVPGDLGRDAAPSLKSPHPRLRVISSIGAA